MSNVPRTQGDESANLRKAVEGLLHTIATQVPRDAPFSFMLTRDVAEVSRALVTLSAARAHRGAADASTPAPAWSGEAPKVDGAYWRRGRGPVCVVMVWKALIDGRMTCAAPFSPNGLIERMEGFEWSGPIPRPGAAS